MTQLIFCGIDIAKFEHVASVYNPTSGEYILDSLHFENNDKGLKSLNSNLSKLKKKYEIVVGFESTSHYHQVLFSYLTAKQYKCYLINPHMTNKFRSIDLRDAKNDNIDSRAIATFLSFKYKELIDEEFKVNELKELVNQRDFLMTESSKMKIKLKANLDRAFPELETQFNVNTAAIRAILKEYPGAKAISKARIDKLKSIVKEASKGKYKLSKIDDLKKLAKVSIGIESEAISLNIKQYIETLELKEKQIDIVSESIINYQLVKESPLHQINGINSIEIGYIMSAIISIKRFSSYKKLVAYAGIDPKVRQSGTWQASATRMSKRGNRLLRYALIWASYNISRKEGPMRIYYLKKTSEGKSHYNALGHCANKLCRYIFWILNNPDKEFISK